VPGAEYPSVILITVDTLRADHLTSYGYERPTSPGVARFAQEAMLFEHCYSHAPSTRISFSSLMTGYLPHEVGVIEDRALPQEVETLAEILQRSGYRTLAVVSNYVLQAKRGWSQGFSVFDDEMTSPELNRDVTERISADTTRRAVELLHEYRNEQLFLWVHYQDPHGPYVPPAPYDTLFEASARPPRQLALNRTLSGKGGIPFYQRLGLARNLHDYVARYDGEIRYFDQHFQRLLDTLQELGLHDRALIVFTTDHGEALGEHGFYFSHIGQLYRGLTHVPLIIKHGDSLTGRRKDFCQHLDIVPTILAAAGIEADERLRGRDLRSPLPEGREIFAITDSPIDHDGDKQSLIVDGLKLIVNARTGTRQLFDLREDPGEEHDLAGDERYRQQIDDLTAALERIRNEDRLGLGPPRAAAEYSEEELKRLRSLGYVR
jgi:arylsulfatase